MVLADGLSWYFREMWLRMVYWDETPPWESDTGGGQYQWAPTELRLTLHTASPGEAGSSTTNEATYTGYVANGIAVSRSASAWTLTGAGTAHPIMKPTAELAWPENTGAPQNIAAIAIHMVNGGVLYPMDYVVLGAPVTIGANQVPYIAALDAQLRTR